MRAVRRVWVIPKVFNKPVFLWIRMDVIDQLNQIGLICYVDASEGFFEQATSALKGFVDGLGVTIEEFGKLIADAFGCLCFIRNVGRV
ncbi:MAG: hypothetical protein H6569_04265 [Lewinellaceae bacterium]|nr:hypothetical protein [Lewinellaceae bacterium]